MIVTVANLSHEDSDNETGTREAARAVVVRFVGVL